MQTRGCTPQRINHAYDSMAEIMQLFHTGLEKHAAAAGLSYTHAAPAAGSKKVLAGS